MTPHKDEHKFRVLSFELAHETSTLIPHLTGLEKFNVFLGSEAIQARRNANTELSGVLEVAEEKNWHLDHVFSTQAPPGGKVTKEAFSYFSALILDEIKVSGPYDGIMLNLHGAMITETYDDGEGELLRRIRAEIGEDVPVAMTLDSHANVSPEMCELADIVLGYNTYPHIDMKDIGIRASRILHRAMAKDIKPRTLRVPISMMEEANGGRTDIGPMIARLKAAREHEELEGAFAVSIIAGFPADVAFVGPSVLVTFEGDLAPHQKFAQAIADDIWDNRYGIINTYLSVEDTASLAIAYDRAEHGGKPLVIADYADNPGAGAYGDSTALLQALLDVGVTNTCFAPMVDGEIAAQMQGKRFGDILTINLGGKNDPTQGGGPLALKVELIWAGDGIFTGDGPMIGGLERDLGPTAVLRADGVDIIVSTHAKQIMDLQQFKSFGIIPEDYNVVAIKSMQHFRAAFEPIAGDIIVCDSGALCTPNYRLESFPKVPPETFTGGLKKTWTHYAAEPVIDQ